MKLIITSGHRVGSRWLHYLLAELTGQAVHPEVGTRWLRGAKRQKLLTFLNQGKLLKFHGVMPDKIKAVFPQENIKILAVVRNPRDRAVSFAFHNRYHNRGSFKQKRLKTDADAVRHTVYNDRTFRIEHKQQFRMMVPELSIRNYQGEGPDFMWTCYEWLKEDTLGEVTKILELTKIELDKDKIRETVIEHSFSVKAGRPVGKEDRKDLWRRKGVVGDWKNWFTEKMVEDTQEDYDRYLELLASSEEK